MTFLYEFSKVFYLIVFQFKQIFPYWLLGVILGSILSVYALPQIGGFMERFKNNRFSFVTATIAAVLGVVSPICMYGTIPLIVALGRKGLPQYVIASFMISSILLNPNLLMMSFSLGIPIAIFRLFSCIAAGLMAGILVKIFFKGNNLFKIQEPSNCEATIKKKKHLFKDIHKSITITAPYLLVGIILTALFDRYFPKGYIITLFGQNKGLGVLFAASMGVPIYACGGGSIPLLRLLLTEGMAPGSAIAFMLSGAATKFTNLGAVKIILGVRNFILYIVFNIIFSVCMGILANAIIT